MLIAYSCICGDKVGRVFDIKKKDALTKFHSICGQVFVDAVPSTMADAQRMSLIMGIAKTMVLGPVMLPHETPAIMVRESSVSSQQHSFLPSCLHLILHLSKGTGGILPRWLRLPAQYDRSCHRKTISPKLLPREILLSHTAGLTVPSIAILPPQC